VQPIKKGEQQYTLTVHSLMAVQIALLKSARNVLCS